MDESLFAEQQQFFEELAGQVGDVLGFAEKLQRELQDLTASASSADDLVTVTVGPNGKIVELELDPRIYRDEDVGALAEVIRATVDDAQAGFVKNEIEVRKTILPELDEVSDSFGLDFRGALDPMVVALEERGKEVAE